MKVPKYPIKQILIYENEIYKFYYPKGGQVLSLQTPDRGEITRVIGLVNDKVLQIDIEPTTFELFDKEKELASSEELITNDDSVGPYHVSLGGLDAYRKIFRAFDGGIDLGYFDITVINTSIGVYRISMLCDDDVYDRARRVLEIILNSFKIIRS